MPSDGTGSPTSSGDFAGSSPFALVCSRCKTLSACSYVSERQPLREFLESTKTGETILDYHKKHGKLSATLQLELIHELIRREKEIILKKHNVTLDNPLKTSFA